MFTAFVAFFLITTCLVAAMPSTAIRCEGFLVLLCIYAYAILRSYPIDTPKLPIYQLALQLSLTLLAASDHLVLNPPHQVNHKRQGQTRRAAQMTFFQRFAWSADLVLSLRGASWSWEIPNLRRSRLARWGFVATRLIRMLLCFMLSDFTRILTQQNPAYQVNSSEGFGSRGLFWQTYNVIIFWLTVVANQLFGYSLLSAITVAFGLYEPSDWPSLYGHLSNAKSVRKFWGQTWHQLLRRSLQSHGRYLANEVLGCRSGTKASSYIQLYTAFLLSGLVHSAADWAVTKSIQISRNTFIYYLLQAVIITMEDGLIGFGRSLGVQGVPSILSYSWVIFWMGLTGPIWIEGIIKAGISIQLPFSLVKHASL